LKSSRESLPTTPLFGRADTQLAVGYWAEHKYPETIQEFKTGSQLEGDKNYGQLADAFEAGYRSGGWPAALHKAIEVLLAQRQAKTGYASALIAENYADLGDRGHAFQWLNTAYQERVASLSGLPTDFLFDSLRSDPGYTELVRKIGFPPSWRSGELAWVNFAERPRINLMTRFVSVDLCSVVEQGATYS
jgi:hypothetical protein